MQIKAFLLALAGQALAAPASIQADGVAAVVPRQTAQTVTDQLLFGMTLPSFTSRRNAKNPPTLDWSSDNCSNSPDNPLGFPFSPACHRHDFGYRNYKKQSRFTDSARLRIDNNFKTEYESPSMSPTRSIRLTGVIVSTGSARLCPCGVCVRRLLTSITRQSGFSVEVAPPQASVMTARRSWCRSMRPQLRDTTSSSRRPGLTEKSRSKVLGVCKVGMPWYKWDIFTVSPLHGVEIWASR
jgi:hypothetical protein